MIPVYYGSLFIISLLCSAIYVYIWHKHFDVNFTLIFTLIPIANLGYLTSSLATNAEEFIVGTKISYIGGSFLQLFMMLSIFNICQVEVTKIQRVCLYVISALVYLSVVSIGYTGFFYKNYSYALVGSTPVLVKEYGWMHTVFYLLVVLFFLAGIITIAHAWLKKSQIPRTIVSLLVFPDIVCVVGFIFGKALGGTIELVPVAYILADIIYLIIASRFNLYDVSNTVIDSMTKQREIGYISFDFKYRYLGSNDIAKLLVPDLNGLHVDSLFGYKPSERRIRHFLESFKKDEKNNAFVHTLKSEDGNPENDRIYNVAVNYLYDDNVKKGYIVTFTDDTANRKYIRLLDSYNETLKEEVEEKTKSIVEMHNNLIMGLAKMVESRDNSTGGHITRTSEGVRILVDEIRKEGKLELSDEFCKDVIKAAPMHDLGKIAVDDAILRKPGKFTDVLLTVAGVALTGLGVALVAARRR